MTVRISLALLAYNQVNFIDAAVRSALAQVCEPIQIILSDDCSSDGTFERMRALADGYSGPHRVVVRRNEKNLGIGRHYSSLMQLAEGRLVVIMAGDDISEPQRVARTAQAWDQSAERLDLIAAHLIDMSHQGEDLGPLRVDALQEWRGVDDWARKKPYVVGAAHALTRRLFDRFGPLGAGVSNEDQVTTLRALLSGGAWTIDEPLVRYRRGGLSTTSFSSREYRIWDSRRNAVHLAVCEQWLRDAAIAGVAPQVRKALEWELRWEHFVKSLLEAPTFAKQLEVVRSPWDLDAASRWKKLVKVRVPQLAVAVKRVKESLHGSH